MLTEKINFGGVVREKVIISGGGGGGGGGGGVVLGIQITKSHGRLFFIHFNVLLDTKFSFIRSMNPLLDENYHCYWGSENRNVPTSHAFLCLEVP